MTNYRKKYKSNIDTALFALTLDRQGNQPLQRQLIEALKNILHSDGGCAGARFPASRTLAEELSVSRLTVTNVYDQLVSEGYLVPRTGSGTFVADHLPHLVSPVQKTSEPSEPLEDWLPFHFGVPDQRLFPHKSWARHLEKAWRRPEQALLRRPDPFGFLALRQAISAHLSAWRDLECSPEQVLIVSGAREAFEVILHGIIRSDTNVVVEDPAWPTLKEVLALAGAKVQPVRIDGHGLDAVQIKARASAAIITPSRHFPTGVSMPLSRRVALLDWAKRENAIVVEDDYDSEFRYQGHPLPSIAGMDGLNCCIYMGSFSKLFSPTLRISYLVLPQSHVQKARDYLSKFGTRVSLIPQPALATFMESGEFAVHLRRMRRIYAKRQRFLMDKLSGLGDTLILSADPSGMHVCLRFQPQYAEAGMDQLVVAKGREAGIHLSALSTYSSLPDPPQGLILGYAGYDETQLDAAAEKLIAVLNEFL